MLSDVIKNGNFKIEGLDDEKFVINVNNESFELGYSYQFVNGIFNRVDETFLDKSNQIKTFIELAVRTMIISKKLIDNGEMTLKDLIDILEKEYERLEKTHNLSVYFHSSFLELYFLLIKQNNNFEDFSVTESYD